MGTGNDEITLRERVDPELKPGAKVGDFRVEAKLGEGGFGVVYRARHPLIGKRVAVKVLSRELSSDPEIVKRFEGEARAVNAISHPNIVDISNIGALEDGRHYLVMELLSGESFEDVLSRGRVDPGVLLDVMRGVAPALDAAHAAGVVHRDIKPENIYLHKTPDGRMIPKLLDFGVAKLLGQGLALHQTTTGAPIGTPRYMSPEQCLARTIDSRTDIYALGVVCYEALTGVPPFDAPSLLELMNKHTLAPRPLASSVIEELGTWFDAPITRMMAIDREDRPMSAVEAFTSLEQANAALQSARAGVSGRFTAADLGAQASAPSMAGVSGPWPAAPSAPVGPAAVPPARDSAPSYDVLVERDPATWSSVAPTLVRPSPAAFPAPVPASTMMGMGPAETPLPDAAGPLAQRKPTTLGATSSSLDVNFGATRNRTAWVVAAGAAALVSVLVAVAVILSTNEPDPVVTPDDPTGQPPAGQPELGKPELGLPQPDSRPTPGASLPASPLETANPPPVPRASASASAGNSIPAPIPRKRYRPPRPKPYDPFDHP